MENMKPLKKIIQASNRIKGRKKGSKTKLLAKVEILKKKTLTVRTNVHIKKCVWLLKTITKLLGKRCEFFSVR